MSRVSLSVVAQELEGLTDDERRALRASRFHSTPTSPPPPDRRSRLAHPGGALATNKAAALAKFLKRKLEEPGGAATLNPSLVERAVQNAKITTRSVALPKVRHVDSFSDAEEDPHEESNGKKVHPGCEVGASNSKKKKKKSKAQNLLKPAVTKEVKTKGNKKKKKM
ncbi:hypothetical protein MPTK1_5g24080 [Marchantia polymorpha subsp. ruderalis]|uniref:Uncharacterized protein n=1 Tax=Marchantia polymorpha subsp. ruderalis TaxID=1480154 RepID=A0A176WMA3_MARPO|nr:hypothetical protein AXG93_1757s1080 [Marchantia polymorpha subsp. ruderalis]BBN12932.1 hypothetical protein Mp_5g24080 [Marchantia polymorpha subsp. ruderalis]